MGGKSGASSQAAQQQASQERDAANARAQEQARQDRINTSMGNIKNAFEGAPVMGNRTNTFDWGNVNRQAAQFPAYLAAGGDIGGTQVTGLPAGYHYAQYTTPGTPGTPGTPAAAGAATTPGIAAMTPAARAPVTASTPGAVNVSTNPNVPNWQVPSSQPIYRTGFRGEQMVDGYRNSDGSVTQEPKAAGTAATPGTAAKTNYQIVGPDGKTYNQGDTINYNESYDTGQRTGGFGDDFYNKQKQAVLDYYTPQVNDQYKKARDQTLFAEARAGSLGSRVSTLNTADLAKQYDLNLADVRNKADTAAANERANVAATRSKLESQALAGEDPDTATSQAVNATRNISLDQPATSALGNVFQLATIGGANALKGYNAQNLMSGFAGSNPKSSGRPIGT